MPIETPPSENDFRVWVPYGAVRRPHGLRGELKVEPYAASDGIPDDVIQVRLRHDNGQSLLTRVISSRPANRGDLIHFATIDDRTAAEYWQGAFVELPREQLTTDVFLLCELAGFSVFLAHNEPPVGVVQGLVDHGNQVLLAIDAPDRRRMIPAVDALIAGIDRAKQALYLSLPEGLWDLE